MKEHEVEIKEVINFKTDLVSLSGELIIPQDAQGIILFSHGSGSSRFSPRNNYVAHLLNNHGFGTFLFDLLTEEEDSIYSTRFNIDLLSNRLIKITSQMAEHSLTKGYPFGYFGASTGAASALHAAADLNGFIKAIVSRGGRPDLAMEALPLIESPVLLIVGSLDQTVITLNEKALKELHSVKQLEIIQGASHLFEEPGKLDQVADLSINWFKKYLHK